MFTKLSVDCMIKGETPSAAMEPTSAGVRRRFSLRMRRWVFLPSRNQTIHTALTACEMMVASAAPRTPMFSTKMKMGSSTILLTAPISTLSMAVVAKPWALMKALSPSENITKTVPSR